MSARTVPTRETAADMTRSAMSLSSHRRRGVTLRHWTTDGVSFVGGRVTPRPAIVDQEIADSRRLNLVASKLKLLRAMPDDKNRAAAGRET